MTHGRLHDNSHHDHRNPRRPDRVARRCVFWEIGGQWEKEIERIGPGQQHTHAEAQLAELLRLDLDLEDAPLDAAAIFPEDLGDAGPSGIAGDIVGGDVKELYGCSEWLPPG